MLRGARREATLGRRSRPRLPLAARRALAAALLLLPVALYLRDWAFEGLVRVGSNGRLRQLRFAPPSVVLQSCPPPPEGEPAADAYAYVTSLSTPDYLPGVRALAQALRTGGAAHPLLVLIPDDLPAGLEEPLVADAAASGAADSAAPQALRVPRLRYAAGWTTAGCRYWWLNAAGHYAELEHSLTKLWVWNLTRYNALLYLDADTLPLGAAPDELFGLAAARPGGRAGPPLFAAAPDWGRHGGDAPGFNAGVFLTTPCGGLTGRLRALAADARHARDARCARRGTADQPLLQYYWGLDAIGLPMRYNALQPGLAARPRLAAAYPPRLVHFTKVKPWQAYPPAADAAPEFASWAAACDTVSCCAPPARCGAPPRYPRGPHFDAVAVAS